MAITLDWFVLDAFIWSGRSRTEVRIQTGCNLWHKLTKPVDGVAAQSLLNRALEEDKLDDGCVCCSTRFFPDRANTLPRSSPSRSTWRLRILLSSHLVNVPLSIQVPYLCEKFFWQRYREIISRNPRYKRPIVVQRHLQNGS